MGLDQDIANALFRLLGPGPASPLPDLAQRLSVSTTVIADLLTRWQIEGLPLAGTGHGSPRLAPGFERLDAERIRAELDPPHARLAPSSRLSCRGYLDQPGAPGPGPRTSD